MQSEDALRKFLSKVKLPVFAVSLGAVESILSYPAKMSHAALSQEARDKRGISNSLLRLSVGLENVNDLISDFENALSYVEEPVNEKRRYEIRFSYLLFMRFSYIHLNFFFSYSP